MQDIQYQLTVSRGQFLADKRPHKKLTNFGFFFATLHFSTRSIKWTYLEEILGKFAYPTMVYATLNSCRLVACKILLLARAANRPSARDDRVSCIQFDW